MTDQSLASFPRPDAPLVLLGASGLGQRGEAVVSGSRECLVAHLWLSYLPSWGNVGKHHFDPGTMNAVSLAPDTGLFTPRVAGVGIKQWTSVSIKTLLPLKALSKHLPSEGSFLR